VLRGTCITFTTFGEASDSMERGRCSKLGSVAGTATASGDRADSCRACNQRPGSCHSHGVRIVVDRHNEIRLASTACACSPGTYAPAAGAREAQRSLHQSGRGRGVFNSLATSINGIFTTRLRFTTTTGIASVATCAAAAASVAGGVADAVTSGVASATYQQRCSSCTDVAAGFHSAGP